MKFEIAVKVWDQLGYVPLNMRDGTLKIVKIADYGENNIKDFNSGKISVLYPITNTIQYILD